MCPGSIYIITYRFGYPSLRVISIWIPLLTGSIYVITYRFSMENPQIPKIYDLAIIIPGRIPPDARVAVPSVMEPFWVGALRAPTFGCKVMGCYFRLSTFRVEGNQPQNNAIKMKY